MANISVKIICYFKGFYSPEKISNVKQHRLQFSQNGETIEENC